MFTGLIEEVGIVDDMLMDGDRARLRIRAEHVIGDLPVGASIAVDGVCVTATEVSGSGFAVDLMRETLEVTAFRRVERGQRVNLERAMLVGGRLGGHLVQGHVDGVGDVQSIEAVPGTTTLRIRIPGALRHYLVQKGSLCVSGVSLTIANLEDDIVTIGLIPHTLSETNLGDLVAGSPVNLEVDVVAKYVERMLPPRAIEEK